MLPLLFALATMTVVPTVQFTSDSVYAKQNIISYEVVANLADDEEHTLISKDLVLKENHLLGYTIYDNKDTEYIDGIRVDGQYVFNWRVENFDDTIEHIIQVKTVYTDDAAGMLVAAKDGDWTKLLSNPLIIFQLVYYLLAAVSIIAGGFGLVKAKKKKVKDREDIAKAVYDQAESAKDALVETSISIISPLFEKLGRQNADIIKALIMSKSKDDNDTLALLDLLNHSIDGEDFSALVNRIKIEAQEAFNKKITAQKEAKATIAAIANGTFKAEEEKKEEKLKEENKPSEEDKLGGLSI